MLSRTIVRSALLVALAIASVVRVAGAAPPDVKSQRLSELKRDHLDRSGTAAFWQEVDRISRSGGYPFVEEIEGPRESPDNYVRVTFLHRMGDVAPKNVLLFANINHVLASELLFERIPYTDVYFKSVEVPRGVRFEYRILENDPLTGIFAGAKYGTRMNLLGGDPDPLNPNKRVYPDELGEGKDYIDTWVELPGASPQPYIIDRGNPKGKLVRMERESAILGYSHGVLCYTPPGYDASKAYPLLILFDGDVYFTGGSFALTMENLIADGAIPPMVVLGVNAGRKDGRTQRNDEFTCNPRFMQCLATELIPWFESQYHVTSDPRHRIIAGSSFGGLFAAYFAFNHPEIVTNVLTQSGSYHWGRSTDPIGYEWLVRELAFSEKKPLSIYMEVGKLEGEYSWTYPYFPNQVVSHRHFKTILDMRGYDVKYVEYGGGHEMLSWRGGIADGLIHLTHAAGWGGS